MPNIHIYHGPNLNMLGKRETEKYGDRTLQDIQEGLNRQAERHDDVTLVHKQFNNEGELLSAIHELFEDGEAGGLVINPAAWSHNSIALRDALTMLHIPIVEVHLTNIHAREEFRHHSYVSGVVEGVICGLGIHGYHMALGYLLAKL